MWQSVWISSNMAYHLNVPKGIELNQAHKVIRAWILKFDQNVKDSSGLDAL